MELKVNLSESASAVLASIGSGQGCVVVHIGDRVGNGAEVNTGFADVTPGAEPAFDMIADALEFAARDLRRHIGTAVPKPAVRLVSADEMPAEITQVDTIDEGRSSGIMASLGAGLSVKERDILMTVLDRLLEDEDDASR